MRKKIKSKLLKESADIKLETVKLPKLHTDKELEEKQMQQKINERLMILVNPEYRIDQEIKDLAAELSGNFVMLLITEPSKYSQLQRATLRYFVNELKIPGIYITTNKPYETLQSDFTKANLDLSKVSFIDMVTEMAYGESYKISCCKYLGSMTDLTELVEYLDSISSDHNLEGKFLILDSISTMLIYNEAEEVERLTHTLLTKARKWRMKTILLSTENVEQKSIIETIGQFCDSVSKIK